MKNKDEDPLVGKFFHSVRHGKLHWQGQILARIPRTNFYLVQLFEWMLGGPSDQRVVRVSLMASEFNQWIFYETNGDMLAAGTERLLKNEL